jgi:DNA-binding SARP family transcriptional activator
LALLVLRRGEAVATDRLVDELWGERAPPTAIKVVQTYVSQLRRALGDGVLVTRGRAYVLDVGPVAVDAERFAAQLVRGRELLAGGDAAGALATLRGALDLWRGPALADLAWEPFAQAAIGRLEELRLAAVETGIEAELALGRHAEVTPELEGLVRDHPLRERLQGQLMLSLYRSGRRPRRWRCSPPRAGAWSTSSASSPARSCSSSNGGYLPRIRR